jgi:hypothetical protein
VANLNNTSYDKVWEGFWYTVTWNWNKVIKTPRNQLSRILNDEKEALKTHQDYLWESIPSTEFKQTKGWYEVHQDFIRWNPVDLMTTTNDKVFELLDAWISMQEKEKILFDVFGLEWMVRLFNYYFSDTYLWKAKDISLPIAASILQLIHHFPKEKLEELNNDKTSPFIVPNIIEEDNWNVKFVDIEHRELISPRSISSLKKYPLNLLWAWITKKALTDVQRRRKE